MVTLHQQLSQTNLRPNSYLHSVVWPVAEWLTLNLQLLPYWLSNILPILELDHYYSSRLEINRKLVADVMWSGFHELLNQVDFKEMSTLYNQTKKVREQMLEILWWLWNWSSLFLHHNAFPTNSSYQMLNLCPILPSILFRLPFKKSWVCFKV